MWPKLVLSTGCVCLVELGILSIRERGVWWLKSSARRTCRDMRELEGEARRDTRRRNRNRKTDWIAGEVAWKEVELLSWQIHSKDLMITLMCVGTFQLWHISVFKFQSDPLSWCCAKCWDGDSDQCCAQLTYTLVRRPTHTAVLKPFPLTHASLA